MSGPKPSVVSIVAILLCGCGNEEEFEFEGVQDGWEHSYPCDDCGERVSIQIETLVQNLRNQP
jgi:hypothetical protein